MTQERVLIDDSIFNLKVVLFNFVVDFFLDLEQSLFFSKIRGKERKTSKRASVTVIVTPLACNSHSHACTLTCFAFFPWITVLALYFPLRVYQHLCRLFIDFMKFPF